MTSLTRKLKRRSVQEKVLFTRAGRSFIIKILGAGLGLGINVLLGRTLGVKGYGAYTFIFSWVSMIIVFLPLGFDKSALRFIPEYRQQRDWSGLRGFLVVSFKIVALLSLSVTLLIIGSSFFIDTSSWGYSKELIITGAILLLLMGLMRITLRSLMGFKKILAALIPQAMIVQVVMAISLLSFFYFKDSLTVENAMISKLIGVFVAFFTGVFLLQKSLPKQVHVIKRRRRDKYWMKISFPMMLISGAFLILGKTDLIMIGFMLGKEDTGVYGAVIKFSSLVLFGLQAITVVLAPQISELYHSNQKEDLQKVIKFANRISFAFALCGTFFFIFFGKFVLSIFGESFVSGYDALLIFMTGYLFNAFSGSTTYIMTMTGHQKMAFKILASSGLVNIILNYFLIQKMGIEGAAISSAFSMILWNVIMIIYIKKKLSLNATIF